MVTLFNAISLDGYLATKDDDTSWVKDAEIYEEALKNFEAVIYGRRTYDDMIKNGTFPLPNIKNIIYTSNPQNYQSSDNVIFTNKEPQELLSEFASQGITKIMLAGGGTTNGMFLNAGLIDNAVLDIHSTILGDGIKLFEGNSNRFEFEMLESREVMSGVVQMIVKVK